jgi:threonine dehydratase
MQKPVQTKERTMPDFGVTVSDVYMARRRIAPLVARTPLMRSVLLEREAGVPVYVKLENVQHTGSFKLRGAANKLLALSEEERARGVIAVSSGNHGRAVSYVAGALGIDALVCLSENVPQNKVEGIRRYGAQVISVGESYDEATEHAFRLREERGLTFVHPFDGPLVIAGQGTIGLEILEDLPDVDTIIVPLSGGGLAAGIGLAARAAGSGVRVIGVTMDRAPVMYASLKAGKVVEMAEEPTLADALVGGLGPVNRYTFPMCQQLVDEAVLVSDDEIAEAMAFMLEGHHMVVEGGAAVGVAALLNGRAGIGERVAVVVTGCNVDIPLLVEIAEKHGMG